ncbi:MAG TPA: translation initiation factor IF-2 [Isosphaeraceae bacterium]|nr:translation initiation factor IF-2 [Isosphaeraceae bacterium]
MSTRVHELAKELGLKSQELLDRIQRWGLDVKASALASLDPAMVDRIKQLMRNPTAAPAAPAAATPSPRSSPSEAIAISSKATAPARPSIPPAPAPSAPAATPPTTEPAGASAAGVVPAPAPPPAAPVPTLAGAASGAGASSAPAAPGGLAPTAPTIPPSAPATPAPSARPSGLTSPPRVGGGPLSGHTPHRGAAAGARSRPAAAPPGSQHELRPNPTTPPPLKPSDYMSSAGIRQPIGRPGAPASPSRRPGDESSGGPSGESPRREPSSGTRRPLPAVASVAPASQPRRTSGPRPGAAPEVKTQRPERRYTPEELMAMMRAGQLGTQAPGKTPPHPGTASARPSGATRPSGPSGPSGPPPSPPGGPLPTGPGLRRPAMGAPAAPPVAPVVEEDEERRGKGAAASRLGTAADRAGRRAKRNERANERRVSSPVPASALLNESEEEGHRSRSGGRRAHRHGGQRTALAPTRKARAEIEPPITVRGLSEVIGIRANDLIKRMMTSLGQLVTINATLDDETAQMLALEFGVELEVVHERTAEDELLAAMEAPEAESAEGLGPRPPVITILGHVDHGKTSLLDKIRKANVVATETGGITQHIGAYQVEHDGRQITFVDTPGHEAFTAMRARGANVTDIVVLVVAADDGVMPQTKEAIDHAKAAEVPIVVALNKIDLPNVDAAANINKIYSELSQQGLTPEEWGGDTPVVKTSTVTGQGIDDLLATLDALAELHELKANPNRPAAGTCLEASISEGRGVTATVLVQDGTLHVGDVIVCGDGFGRVRALFDDKGRSVAAAGPSTPVEISGLDAVPMAGEKFAAIDDISRAREIAEARRSRTRGVSLGERQAITLENLYSKMAEQKVKSLNLILKADVQGSLEALTKELEKLENAEVPIRVLLKGVGGITESDILLADASQAIIIGFRVAPEDRAVTLADEKKIEIRRYDIIYQVTDEIKKAVEGMLVPEIKEVHLGRAVVRQIFKISKVGTVAGCFVTQGVIERSAKARLIREGREIYKGAIEALKRFKDDVREVREGFECGIKIANFDDLKIDDVIEAYRIDVIRRTL